MIWLITMAVFNATVVPKKNSPSNFAAANGFRNAYMQTIVPPYSVRRRPHAPVSMPLDWDEVTTKLDPSRFNIRTFDKRLAKADPWKDFTKSAVRLPS